MKCTKLKLCSAVLSATTLMSMLTFLPTNAAEIKAATPKNVTSIETVKDDNGTHYYGPTGNNLSDNADIPDDVTIIENLSEYNEITGNTPVTGINNKPLKKSGKLPEIVDNSESIYFPEIGDQGQLGSCLFWAQVYYQYTYEMNKSMGIPTTPENAFSPQWSYNVATAGSDLMCYTITSLDFMMRQGSVPMSQVPYDSDYRNMHAKEEIWRNSINYRIKGYQMFEDIGTIDTRVTSPDDSDLELIKTALSNGEILTYSTLMYGWTHVDLKTNSAAPENDKHIGEVAVTSMDNPEGGHRMTLVGYNDNLWIDINNNDKVDKGEMGAFKIANSWGTEYGNDGYCWVAYDALNRTSCVEGVEYNNLRDCIFTEVTRFELLPYGTGTDLYFNYTLNTADRTQVNIKIIAEKDGIEYTFSPKSNISYGDPVSYDGTMTATDGTLIYPVQCDLPELTSENFAEYNWNITFEDTKKDGYPLIVKDAKVVDEKNEKTYQISDSNPFVIDGESKNIQICESNLNHAVVYYRGYYTPSISYKLDKSDAEWQNDIAIEENYEKYGYTHKFVIDLETSDKATLYFTDKNGDIDNNNGRYFTATKGINTYVTENMAKPMSVKMTNDFNEIADVGRFGIFKTETSGGYKPYKYEYVITNLTTGEVTVEDYHISPEKGFYSTQKGDYKVVVNAKDCTGKIVSDVNYFTITEIPFEFTSFDVTAKNNTLVNAHPVTFKAVTNFENIGLRYEVYHDYNLTIKRGNEICYEKTLPMVYERTNPEYMTSTIIANWTPIQSGTYTATISATDCAGEYAEKSIVFTVNECIIGDADGNGTINVADVTFLQMYLAKTTDEECMRIDNADTDKNSIVNIDDATYIQMYIAMYPDVQFVGHVLYSDLLPTTQPATQPATQPTTENTTQITFINSLNWSGNIFCYYWSDNNDYMTYWPGEEMTHSSTGDQDFYTFDIPDDATYIIFTNNSSQTVTINYNGFNTNFYPLTSTDENGYHKVTSW